MKQLIDIINNTIKKREEIALCTIVSTSGSTPLKSGAKMLVWKSQVSYGTIGGGRIELKVTEDAVNAIEKKESGLYEYNLIKEEMCCGGTVKIFIEPILRTKQLIIFGAGHIGSHIAYFANKLNFKTVIVDERYELLSKITDVTAEKLNLSHHKAFSEIITDEDTYIVIATHLHEYDREILAHYIGKKLGYLGMIGSKRKIIITRKKFLNQNVCSEEELNSVDMPMGYNIGQNGPAEIALGIISKIVAVSSGKQINEENTLNEYEEAFVDSNGCI